MISFIPQSVSYVQYVTSSKDEYMDVKPVSKKAYEDIV